ncbi:MAG: helix-turn-helix domain-containing protein [Micropruina sp.]|uniref:TetR/AcrR family transcriptional regulator n=1 Tax=Micropruina sp. TaxID=2737536 RepID=UPI0039E37BD3
MGRWDRTHQALQRAAVELFAERGYEATTTAQVAERAGVSEMTLFRHFATKEALLLADPFDPLMAEAVRARPGEEPPMRALVQGIRQAWLQVDAESTQKLREILLIVARTPALRGAVERNSNDTAAALTAALLDRGVLEAPARIAVAAVIAGLSTALLDWAQMEGASLDDVLASAVDVLGGE